MGKNKVLITGAGYIAERLVNRLKDEEIILVDRREGDLVAFKEKYPNIEIVVGDIADEFTCDKVCKDAKAIYHLAAMKHVTLSENDVRECINSNIIGTMNLLECSRKYKTELMFGMSTDKASDVKCVYSATKFLMERLFREYELMNPDTKYRMIRYGNVFGSTGSVSTKWKPLIEQGKEVIITNPEATRFFGTAEDTVDFILESIDKAKDSIPLVPVMKAISMGNMLKAYQQYYRDCPVKEIGLQPGENMHETMDGINYSDKAEQFRINEFIIKFL